MPSLPFPPPSCSPAWPAATYCQAAKLAFLADVSFTVDVTGEGSLAVEFVSSAITSGYKYAPHGSARAAMF